MSLYHYKPLNRSENEIRILRFPATAPDGDSPVRCTIQHVSLDAFLPTYRLYLEEQKPSTPVSAVRGWLDAHRSDRSWTDTGIKPIVIDMWRYSAEYEELWTVSDICPDASKSHMVIPSRYDWGDFEAVSYCWESNIRDRDVLVDDKIIRVTSNLEAMLRELQSLPEAHSGIGFWVDGLCINQEDILEKNHQVGLMSRIYSQAFSTVVWLGPSTLSSDKAVEELVQSFGDCRVSYTEYEGDQWTLHLGSTQLFPFQCWPALVELCTRQYFKRMWIIQELALNKNMTMFMCGDRRFSRVYLQGMCKSARTNAASISTALDNADLPADYRVPIKHDFVWGTANDVYSLIKLRGSNKGLNQLLDSVRKAKATDPRDKVYGMLGLLPRHVASQLQPDYSKTKSEIFLELATSILHRCERLDELLSWCAFNEASTLPSWVPDWEFTHERRHLRRFREVKAGGDCSPKWCFQSSVLGLCVGAVRLGQVNSSSSPVQSLLPYKVTGESKTPLAHVSSIYGRYNSRDHLLMALERTLMHNHPKRRAGGNLTDIPWADWHTDRPHVLEGTTDIIDQWQYFDRFRQSNASLPIFGITFKDFFTATDVDDVGLNASDKKFDWGLLLSKKAHSSEYDNRADKYISPHASNLRRTVIALQHRRLCTTQTGFLGLAPNEIKIGDTVAIILGCNYPVLLRPFDNGFKYVGECYIDGMMEGEAIEAANNGQYQIEDIVLL